MGTAFLSVRPGVRALRERLVATRRDLHEHPELSWKEERTQRVILERLAEIGLSDVRPIARTGATGVIHGAKPGIGVLWRADIDALPVPEKTGLVFASKNEGVMHACGHDAHTAIALGIAEALNTRRDVLAGSVRFVFQPAEEAAGGARACLDDGVLESPHIDRALGLHISADVPLGAINVAPGPFFAAPRVGNALKRSCPAIESCSRSFRIATPLSSRSAENVVFAALRSATSCRFWKRAARTACGSACGSAPFA